MTEDKKPTKIVFAPGCFDHFEGTQEELDQFIAEIEEMFKNPDQVLANSIPVDIDDLDDETLEQLAQQLGIGDDDESERILH